MDHFIIGLRKNTNQYTDIDYYLHKQILPPVERLCAPVSGTNVTQLADCLGLDTSKYRVSTVSGTNNAEAEIQPLESQIPDSIRFQDTSPLLLRCRLCKEIFAFRGILPTSPTSEEDKPSGIVNHDGIICPSESCKAQMQNLALVAQLESQIRQHLAKYYQGWLVCDDASCGLRTRSISVYGHRCLGLKGLGHGCSGRMRYEYSEKMLYNQLLYFSSLFNVDKAKEQAKKVLLNAETETKQKTDVLVECNRERFGTAKDIVKSYLDHNGGQWVDMHTLFGFIRR
jgi:DNA polymerase alpha subunit A